ncbi:MAG: DNA polymerase I [Candidatus Zixiibacteriota bacterium]|jgi:DNA polymerase-1
MSLKTRLLVVDTMNLIFRAYYALISRPLRTTDGRNTSAIFGFARMILRALADYQPTHVAVALEGGGPSFREELYSEYKGTRKAPPDDLVYQIEPIKELARLLGLAVIEKEAMEADDVVATLARGGAGDFDEVLILSGDKDLMSLVGGPVRVLAPRTGVSDMEEMDEAAVEAKMGVPPAAIPDLLALEGDSVDNVPGVPGIGAKTARALLEQYGTLDAVFEHVDEVEPKRARTALEKGREVGELSRKLVALRDDLDLGLDAAALAPRGRDEAALGKFFKDYELKTLEDELGLAPPPADEITADLVAADEFLPPVAGTAGHWLAVEAIFRGDGFAGVAVAGGGRATRYDGTPEEVAARLTALSEESALPLAGHDTKRLAHVFGRAVKFDGDTMLAAYLLNPERTNYRLAELAYEYLKLQLPAEEDTSGELDFGERAGETAAARAQAIGRLAEETGRLVEQQEMVDLYRDLEVPLAPVLADLERRGIAIDRDKFRKLAKSFEKHLAQAEAELYDIAGGEFNPNSPKQLREILFEKLGLKPRRKTKTGFSTAADVLETLAEEHPLPGKIIGYRELAKLKNTYVDVLPTLADAEGRIHTTFNQAATATGRLSSTDPNLQNIPIRTDLGAEIRKAFIPAKGKVFLSADYAQVELRILAHVADDPGLQKAFAEGKDIHAATAAELFDVPFDEITREQRSLAKAINFGLAYKMGPRRLARETGLSVKEAESYIEKYFTRYPGVARFIDEEIERAHREGYVHTVLGRRRYLPDIASDNSRARAAAERVAVNMPIQGSAADILKLAMVAVDRRLGEGKFDAAMLLTIHDELLFEVAPGDVPALTELAREEMTGVLNLKVPLEVHIGVGDNWFDAHG